MKDYLKNYIEKNRKKCFALRDWLNLKGNLFTFEEALQCIYDDANGNSIVMNDIIEHLTEKRKTYGRTQVYADDNSSLIGMKRDENGNPIIYGYRDNLPTALRGQHMANNPKIFRKSDDQVSKNYQKSEEKMYELGSQIRELFPSLSNHELTFIMQAVKKYAESRKISNDKVVASIKKGRLKYDDELNRLVPSIRESKNHIILIREDVASEIANELKMTEYKFNSNIKQFLHDLMVNPNVAETPLIFKQGGFNRNKLVYFLKKFDLLRKSEKISDKDSDGNPKTATMMVTYQVPKKNFDRKLHKLYIRLFEDNTTEQNANLTEDGECCGATTCDASSGQFIQPLFSMQKKTFNE